MIKQFLILQCNNKIILKYYDENYINDYIIK